MWNECAVGECSQIWLLSELFCVQLLKKHKGGFVQMFEVTHLINDNMSEFYLSLQTCTCQCTSHSLMLYFSMMKYDSNEMKCDWTPSRY